MFSDQHRRILVTDSDRETRDRFATLLRHKGLIVDETGDDRTALELVRENAYTVVMLDVAVDGLGILNALDPISAHPPVVLVVNGSERVSIRHFDARRIHGIVRKPFDLEELAGVVAACAEVRGRSTLETMMYATMMSGAPLIALLRL